MTAPQFTPGPWDAIWWAAVLRDLHNFLPDELREDEGDPRYLYPGLSTFQSEQDAHLIAAAPELYANAEFLCDRLRDLEGYDGDELLRQLMGHVLPAFARMETSLAKARGEHA
jgi:hypothetical protein